MKKNGVQKSKPIHPFAARMAPEIAFRAIQNLPRQAVILDPMAGSGTVLRTVADLGYDGLGFDIDPLSVLMSKAWTTKVNEKKINQKVEEITEKALKLKLRNIRLPWIDNDVATKNFISFWFAKKQINELRRLSYIINKEKGTYANVLKIALSRLIITKTNGASLAADVSHSRPHRVRSSNSYRVIENYKISCNKIAKILGSENQMGNVQVKRGDARRLTTVKNNSIDCIMTSPPYLNALDYMRGHKLALVWLGYSISELSRIRSSSVGAEKAPDSDQNIKLAKSITKNIKKLSDLPERKLKMVYRYALDMHSLMKESNRVLKRGCEATFVIGNSCIEGIHISNSSIVTSAAKKFQFEVVSHTRRKIPDTKRYLPPPSAKIKSDMSKRMRTESVITFKKK